MSKHEPRPKGMLCMYRDKYPRGTMCFQKGCNKHNACMEAAPYSPEGSPERAALAEYNAEQQLWGKQNV